MWNLSFISEEDFTDHVKATIQKYGEKLKSFDLKRFNKNIVDPVKLIFDKTVYRSSWEEIVSNEIFRQRDKSNNNDIGYFHQNQLDGDGILYLKTRNIFFIGHLSNGEYDEGAYLDLNKDIYYRGKFKEGKKNDDHCTMIEMKNKHIFVGKVTDDVFERGYLCSFNTEELNVKDENDKDMPVTQFNMEKIFYFYKDKDENKQFVYQFQKDFKEVLNDNFRKIFELETQTKKFYEKITYAID